MDYKANLFIIPLGYKKRVFNDGICYSCGLILCCCGQVFYLSSIDIFYSIKYEFSYIRSDTHQAQVKVMKRHFVTPNASPQTTYESGINSLRTGVNKGLDMWFEVIEP